MSYFQYNKINFTFFQQANGQQIVQAVPAQTAKVLQQQPQATPAPPAPQQTTQRIVQQNENNLPPVTVLQTQAGQSGQAVQGMGSNISYEIYFSSLNSNGTYILKM